MAGCPGYRSTESQPRSRRRSGERQRRHDAHWPRRSRAAAFADGVREFLRRPGRPRGDGPGTERRGRRPGVGAGRRAERRALALALRKRPFHCWRGPDTRWPSIHSCRRHAPVVFLSESRPVLGDGRSLEPGSRQGPDTRVAGNRRPRKARDNANSCARGSHGNVRADYEDVSPDARSPTAVRHPASARATRRRPSRLVGGVRRRPDPACRRVRERRRPAADSR
jgi:hypothetical protein